MTLFQASELERAVHVSRLQPEDPLGCTIQRPFELDGFEWPTAEHYYQAMKYPGRKRFEEIQQAATPEQARRIGRGWLKRPRSDWDTVRTVVMTRAIYTQCQIYAEFSEALLATGEQKIVDVSQYDYFWGLGRDLRGENQYGTLLMAVREKVFSLKSR